MNLRFSLLTKIVLWLALNLIALGMILFFLQFRLTPASPLLGEASNRIEAIIHLISRELQDDTENRDEVLRRYSEAYRVDFLLYKNSGEKIAGADLSLPEEVKEHLVRPPHPPPFSFGAAPPSDSGPEGFRPSPPVRFKTSAAKPYWFLVRIPFFEKRDRQPIKASILVASESDTAHGLFYNPAPKLILLVIAIFLFSVLLWIPLVRNITHSLKEMTGAAEQIAEEHFDVRVNDQRSDEIGRLGKTINQLAMRLSGFVGGQKRFLGDISHELNSPLARMQFALGILEDRVDEANRNYVADVQEEVQLMSKLVSELLAYSKAGIKQTSVKLERVRLLPLIEEAIQREAAQPDRIHLNIAPEIEVSAQPNLLERAVSNVIRNAIRYAGNAGPIIISAFREEKTIKILIQDCGPGVPEESIGKIFDPFFRLESDRSRQTGGTGLGMAIVKTCIEACDGEVTAQNRVPSGLEITIRVKACSE